MNKELFKRVKQLNLSEGKYAIFGSAPMCIRDLRKCRDLDLIVIDDVFEEYKQKEGWVLKNFKRDGRYIEMLENNRIEFYKTWGPGDWDTQKLINKAETIDGLPFVKLIDVIRWKEISGRDKDLQDIELINNYLSKS